MVTVAQLWLPILVSAVFVFIASAFAWMALPHHKKDILPLPKESPIPGQTRDLKPGVYMYPSCGDRKEMGTDEFKKRFNEGPWGVLNVLPSKPNMARCMIMVFIAYVLVGVFVGYVTGLARAPGAGYLEVFRVAGATAVGIYCLGWMPHAIFHGKPARAWATDLIDGVVYGLITAGTFAWLWPSGSDAVNALLNG